MGKFGRRRALGGIPLQASAQTRLQGQCESAWKRIRVPVQRARVPKVLVGDERPDRCATESDAVPSKGQSGSSSSAHADASTSVSGSRAEALALVGAAITYTVHGHTVAGLEAGPADEGAASTTPTGCSAAPGVATCGSAYEGRTRSTTPSYADSGWVA